MKSFSARHLHFAVLVALTGLLFGANTFALRPGEFSWEPELSGNGPLVVIISLSDQSLSAYRNGIRIARSSISSGTKGRSTPTGVFTILEKEVTHFSNKYHHAPMTGRDDLIDFNCTSAREEGICFFTNCNDNLLRFREAALYRRKHDKLAHRPFNRLLLPTEHS